MALPEFEPPPTYALPVITDEIGIEKFNPIWINWFIKLVRYLNAGGGPLPNPTINVMVSQVFGTRNAEAALSQIRRLGSNGQIILGGQIFGG